MTCVAWRCRTATSTSGLPPREAEFLATLVRDGDVGLELCKDPPMPIVVGVFPMRPVTRA